LRRFEQVTGDAVSHDVCNESFLEFRHVDSAQAYRNEGAVGEAVRDSGIDRSECFICHSSKGDSGDENFCVFT
jgi:diketogulonate reductase-like aldo/keto reductase